MYSVVAKGKNAGMPCTVRITDPAEVAQLLSTLDAYLQALYPPEDNHILGIERLQRPDVHFLAAWSGSTPAACGAFVRHDGYAEIKRMIVSPDFRRQGLGRAILLRLEERMAVERIGLARLETGIHQPEAIALYERCGYAQRGPFGDYAPSRVSVFMEKALPARA